MFVVAESNVALADDNAELRRQFEELQKQNADLQRQLQQQQQTLDKLTKQVGEIQQAGGASPAPPEPSPASGIAGLNFGQVHIGGEGGVAFFHTGSEGAWPNSEFRIDEAKLFVEAPIWGDVFVFGEINIAAREYNDLELDLGELYLDFEDVSQLWGAERQLNIRAGRFDIPFGEEYVTRDAIDNPLISRSVVDLWGVDEGIEFYGAFGKVSYVFAVQNGSVPGAADFDGDKSLTARLSFDPNSWLHLSVSGMRTGDIDATDDYLSELWIGGGWFRSIGSPATTEFHANLVQSDVRVRLPHGHLKAFGGYARYDDDDPTADNRRDIYYYSVEAEHRFTRKLYAAARFSQMFAEDGYPLLGYRPMDDFFSGAVMTEELWRLSLGLGYRFSENLVVKTEYSFEGGRETNGDKRAHENFFGAEAAFKF